MMTKAMKTSYDHNTDSELFTDNLYNSSSSVHRFENGPHYQGRAKMLVWKVHRRVTKNRSGRYNKLVTKMWESSYTGRNYSRYCCLYTNIYLQAIRINFPRKRDSLDTYYVETKVFFLLL